MTERPWHALDPEDVTRTLGTDPRTGLSTAEAQERLLRYGPNTLPQSQTRSAWLRFVDQLKAPLVVILLASAAILVAIGGLADAAVILGVVLVNAVIGFIQEGKALHELEALRSSVVTVTTVVRDGQYETVPSANIVVGDVVLLNAGDRVPADMRLLRCHELLINESTLTGESLSVEKNIHPVAEQMGVADRTCLAFAATTVMSGSGLAVVVATATATQVGKVAGLIRDTDRLKTPLTTMIARLSSVVMIAILVLAAVTFAIGLARGLDASTMLLAAVALAVGAIPEGLPAAVTVILALGVARMAKRGALIRELPAVETLGSTTVICTDKTGTLTKNQVTLVGVLTPSGYHTVEGVGYALEGTIQREDGPHAALDWCLKVSALCRTGSVQQVNGEWVAIGDPTESALAVFAHKGGYPLSAESHQYPQVDVVPFSSELQYMATLHADPDGQRFIAVKGATEVVTSFCSMMVMDDGTLQPCNVKAILDRMEAASSNGRRVLALAYKMVSADCDQITPEQLHDGCVFCGLAELIDPPRQEVADAIRTCQEAGIEVKMITGDHVATARAIARDLHMEPEDTNDAWAFTGQELASMTDAEFAVAAQRGRVFARVSPEQKLHLVRAMQAASHVVAMAGDGVNDAPALKQANIGVAMGRSGTDSAKDVAGVVLTDDNFVTIVAAIKEGRIVFANLMRFLVWVLPTDVAEGLVIVTAVALGADLPIAPVQILWINMITALLLGLPLALELDSPAVMKDPPRDPSQRLLQPWHVQRIVLVGVIILGGVFATYTLEHLIGEGVDAARTAAATTLVMMESLYLFNCRRLDVMHPGPSRMNPYLYAGIGVTMILQVGFVYLPFMNSIFHTVPISPLSWLVSFACAVVLYLAVEGEKRLRTRWSAPYNINRTNHDSHNRRKAPSAS